MKSETFGDFPTEFDSDLFGQLLSAEVVKDSAPPTFIDASGAFDFSQFVNDDSVHQLATPGLVLDENFSPYDGTPDSAHIDFAPLLPNSDFDSLFPATFDPTYSAVFPGLPALDLATCSPQEIGLPSPAVTNSPPFGMLASPAVTTTGLLDQEYEGGELLAEEETGRGKRKRKEGKFTGFRNTATQPVAIDAPIAARNYVLPSATSRKEVPVLIQRQIKKRKLGKKDDVADTEETDVPAAGGLDKEIVDAIAQKRLQNTVAARRSRQRKQEELQRLKDERDEWMNRALQAEARLAAAGL